MTPGTYATGGTAALTDANDLNTLNNVYIEQSISYISPNTDLDNDGRVTPTDVIYVINRLNSGDLSADLDGDSDVDVDDVQMVLNDLGN